MTLSHLWIDPVDPNFEAIAQVKDGRLPLRGTVAATASPLSRFASSAKLASTIAGAALILALIFLFTFALPALFAGV